MFLIVGTKKLTLPDHHFVVKTICRRYVNEYNYFLLTTYVPTYINPAYNNKG